MMSWSLVALARGEWPSARHDGSPWRPSDGWRATKAMQKMPMRAACLYVKGDWAEFTATLGLPSWNSGVRPCYTCNSFGADMYVGAGNEVGCLRWRINAVADYDSACERCEIRVLISTPAQQKSVVDVLRYDKRKEGVRGRALTQGLPELGLRLDDRLEPSDPVPDVGLFDECAVPFQATFWRCSEESLTRHRNPLFAAAETGLSVARLCVDTLHCLYLGVMKFWCRITMWKMFACGYYGLLGTADENLIAAVLVMRSNLFDFYKKRRAEHPGEELTQVADFTPKMCGSRSDQACKTKGGETWGFTLFLLTEIRTIGPVQLPDHDRLLLAGQSLERIVCIWNEHGWVIPAQALEDACLNCQKDTEYRIERSRRISNRALREISNRKMPNPNLWFGHVLQGSDDVLQHPRRFDGGVRVVRAEAPHDVALAGLGGFPGQPKVLRNVGG
jgi:hypothetical protein